jgi:hypothetical protein
VALFKMLDIFQKANTKNLKIPVPLKVTVLWQFLYSMRNIMWLPLCWTSCKNLQFAVVHILKVVINQNSVQWGSLCSWTFISTKWEWQCIRFLPYLDTA